jgi:poly(A) polymerase
MGDAGVLAQVMAGSPNLDRLARLLEVAPESDQVLRLAAMLRDQEHAAEAVAARWRLSNRDAARLLALVRDPLPELRAAAAVPRLLHRWGATHFGDLARIAAAQGKNGTALAAVLAQAATWQPRDLPLGGEDVMALGVARGPLVGAILAQVEAWWVVHDFEPDHHACLAYAAALLRDGDSGETPPSS